MLIFHVFASFLCSHALALIVDDRQFVKILGLFGPDEKEEEFIFQKAVEEANDYLKRSYFRLTPVTAILAPYDSFNTSKTICKELKSEDGIGAIFGPDYDELANIVRSIAGIAKIPHIDTRWDTVSRTTSDIYINLFPESSLLAKAINHVLHDMDWETFTLIYESSLSLVYLQEILKTKMARSNLDRSTVIMKELPQEIDDYGPFLKSIKNSVETRILLHCSPERIIKILKVADQVKLMGKYQSFLITLLDAHTIDFSDFIHVETNITTFRLIDPKNVHVQNSVRKWNKYYPNKLNVNTIKTDTALMRDAVLSFARGLHDMPSNFTTISIDCRQPDIEGWNFGPLLVEKMRSSEFEGMSGGIEFDAKSGKRNFFQLDIIQLINAGSSKLMDLCNVKFENCDPFRSLGAWDPKQFVVLKRNLSQLREESIQSVENKTLKVVTITGQGLPYLRDKTEGNNTLSGNDRFEGYLKDLIEEIANHLHFSYTLEVVTDNVYGHLDPVTGRYTGLLGELTELRADLAICDFTITPERKKVVDFTVPFMNLGISILHTRPPMPPSSYFSFFDPFNFAVWSYLATGYLTLSIALFFIARCTPDEWDCMDKESGKWNNLWSIQNCLWFSLGSVLQQGCDILPRATSTRLTASLWWFFTLIVTSTYTANLAAFLTTQRMDSPIKDVEKLANQDEVKYGCYINGSTLAFFKNSNDSLYQRMYAAMESMTPSVFTESNAKGVERVLNSKHKYAFFMESSTIEYERNRHCELQMVGKPLDTKGYGIALPMHSTYKEAIDYVLLTFQENRKLAELKERWWRNPNNETCDNNELSEEEKNKLRIANVGGVFVLLIFGCLFAFFVSILEFLWNVRKVAVKERITLSEAFWLELKFASKCHRSTKPTRHTPQSGMIGTPLSVSQLAFANRNFST